MSERETYILFQRIDLSFLQGCYDIRPIAPSAPFGLSRSPLSIVTQRFEGCTMRVERCEEEGDIYLGFQGTGSGHRAGRWARNGME